MNKIKKEIKKFICKSTGEEIIFPIAYIEGNTNNNNNKTLAVIGGMHGSEFTGIEAAIKLLHDLETNKLEINGRLIITTIFNIPAFMENRAFIVPNDNKNPLRLFPGEENGSYTEAMNYYFWNEILINADYCIELHGGDIPESIANCIYVPIVENEITDSISRKMAEVYNIKYIIDTKMNKDNKYGGAYSRLAFKGIPSILTEAGGNGILDENNVQVHYDGIKNIMIYLDVLSNEEIKNTEERVILNYTGSIKSDCNGMWYPYVKTGDAIKKGDKVGEIRDYFGSKIKDIISDYNGIVCILKSSPSLKIDDSLVEINEIKK